MIAGRSVSGYTDTKRTVFISRYTTDTMIKAQFECLIVETSGVARGGRGGGGGRSPLNDFAGAFVGKSLSSVGKFWVVGTWKS